MQKYVNLVDLVKSFPTSIYLQKSASIQPRTSLSKFGGKFNSSFIRLLNRRHAYAWRLGLADPREHGGPLLPGDGTARRSEEDGTVIGSTHGLATQLIQSSFDS